MHTNTVKINEKEYFIWKTDRHWSSQANTNLFLFIQAQCGTVVVVGGAISLFFSSRSIHSHTKKHSVYTNIHTSCMRFLLDIFTMVLVGQFVHIVPIASICVTCYLLNYVQNLCIRKMIVATTTTRYFILLNENNNKNNSKWSNRISTIKKWHNKKRNKTRKKKKIEEWRDIFDHYEKWFCVNGVVSNLNRTRTLCSVRWFGAGWKSSRFINPEFWWPFHGLSLF